MNYRIFCIFFFFFFFVKLSLVDTGHLAHGP